MKDKIIEWLYVNDGKFPSKNEWRKAFVEFLEGLEWNCQPHRLQMDQMEELQRRGNSKKVDETLKFDISSPILDIKKSITKTILEEKLLTPNPDLYMTYDYDEDDDEYGKLEMYPENKYELDPHKVYNWIRNNFELK